MPNAENTARFTLEEQGRIRYHLGYGSRQSVSTIGLGVPQATQPLFLVDSAFDSIPISQAQMVRRLVAVLDGIESRMIDAQDRLAAKSVGNIELNPDELDKLENEYIRWAKRLADTMMVPLNPYSTRFGGGTRQSLNSTVRVC